MALLEVEPQVWRRIEVSAAATFWDVHVAINVPQTATTAVAAALLVLLDYRILVVVTVVVTTLVALVPSLWRAEPTPAS